MIPAASQSTILTLSGIALQSKQIYIRSSVAHTVVLIYILITVKVNHKFNRIMVTSVASNEEFMYLFSNGTCNPTYSHEITLF